MRINSDEIEASEVFRCFCSNSIGRTKTATNITRAPMNNIRRGPFAEDLLKLHHPNYMIVGVIAILEIQLHQTMATPQQSPQALWQDRQSCQQLGMKSNIHGGDDLHL